ncbi:hypothetical protein [uncultured Variovorax sp.]|uniref:hypothetical protein n=1 Tax=uncultured Variovorax sp. TaxID=114708 RepID=UPI0025CC4B6C|nr:hypothetical protein [uncultured Variovorax sp.]
MSTDFTFPLALCKAQYGIWLHAVSMFETIGSRLLQDCIALTRAETDAVIRAEDWYALAMAPMQVFGHPKATATAAAHTPQPAGPAAMQPLPSRKAVVNQSLRTLHDALASSPAARRAAAGRSAPAARRHA